MTTLTDPFAPADVRQFVKEWTDKRGNQRSMTFDFIEDESVMDRLDEVVGVGNWSIKVEPISVAEGIVKVRLEALGAIYEDFGYQNREGGEALKEAVSDGIRRVGRMAGIGRYLYRKHDSPNGSSSPVRQTAPASVPQRARGPVNPYAKSAPADPYPEDITALAAPAECPIHHKPYRTGPKGNAYCATKLEDGTWCKEPRR